MEPVDALIVGGGHNGLVAATLLAREGLSVRLLERSGRVGGAAVSERIFPGVDARLSRYAYLVSLFPRSLLRELGVEVELRERRVDATRSPWLRAWQERIRGLAERVAPTMTEPLLARDDFRALVGDEGLWEDVFERPLGEALRRELPDDGERGTVLTDGLIGTFASAESPDLRQNRCFLYHVIGNGIGRWDVPVGGMGHLTDLLGDRARAAGADLRTGAEVSGVQSDGTLAEVACADGSRHRARHLLLNAPLGHLLPRGPSPQPARPEGSQLKVNMLVRRLPRPRDPALTPEQAFTGTFHVNEGYSQLERAYERAESGLLPEPVPCEIYCHSLTDPSILGPALRAAGAHTLTLFALHTPARLFAGDHARAKEKALAATLASLNSALAEPVEEQLLSDADGRPCLEALTPLELQAELGMPAGHIFHRDLQWPFAEHDEEVGRWGVETELPNVWLAGAAARRGGGVSGIPGACAARAVLAAI